MIYLFVYLLFVCIFAREGKREAYFELYMYILAICKEAVSCIFIFTPTVYEIEHYYVLTYTYLYSCSIYYYIYERNNCSIVRIFPEVKVIKKTIGMY